MSKEKIVIIGTSTGGPGHLRKILLSLPQQIDYALVIAQHMNINIVESFAIQMQENSSLSVLLARHKCKIQTGNIYICATSMEFIRLNNQVYLIESEQKDIYFPSVNILFHSATNLLPNLILIAILLTGIGDDGAKGLLDLYSQGAHCIAESKESAVVYGMPKQAYLLNNQLEIMHLEKIVEYLQNV